ncbi:MAG: adenylyltransferase/cytidyltransferase family protein [Candidatus Methanofastidiosa archaeon]|jgi:FAD synthetase|nr:adenylyltransferase/cytidyltransferase family protein [Candidatus Methanofastidiosa archaeon]
MKVLVAGTFDIIHPGHIYLLTEAERLGDVTVVIARDENVKRIKGHATVFTEDERKLIVGSLRMVKDVVLGDPEDFFASVQLIRPDIILLGPDQGDGWLRERLAREHSDIRIERLPKRVEKYSSTKAKALFKRITETKECRE